MKKLIALPSQRRRHRPHRGPGRAYDLLDHRGRHGVFHDQHVPAHGRFDHARDGDEPRRSRDRPHPVAARPVHRLLRRRPTADRGRRRLLQRHASRQVGLHDRCERRLRLRRRQPAVQAGQRHGDLAEHVPHRAGARGLRARAVEPHQRPELRRRPGLRARHRRRRPLRRHRARHARERRRRPDDHRHDRQHRPRRLHLRDQGRARQVQDRGREDRLHRHRTRSPSRRTRSRSSRREPRRRRASSTRTPAPSCSSSRRPRT